MWNRVELSRKNTFASDLNTVNNNYWKSAGRDVIKLTYCPIKFIAFGLISVNCIRTVSWSIRDNKANANGMHKNKSFLEALKKLANNWSIGRKTVGLHVLNATERACARFHFTLYVYKYEFVILNWSFSIGW